MAQFEKSPLSTPTKASSLPGTVSDEMPAPAAGRSARGLLLEGLVIVASILLAFAIDAGWDQMRESEQERRLLAQLTDELDLFIDQLGPASRRISDRVDQDSLRLLDIIHDPDDATDDSWQDAVASLGRAYEFSAATPVIDLLTADGGLQLISESRIREELSNVSSLLGVVARFETLQGDFIADQLMPWLNRNIDQYAVYRRTNPAWADRSVSRFETGIETLRSREFSNLLIERRRLLRTVTFFRGQALERMEGLRDLVGSFSEP